MSDKNRAPVEHADDPLTEAETAKLLYVLLSSGLTRRALRAVIAVPGLAHAMVETLRGDPRMPVSALPPRRGKAT